MMRLLRLYEIYWMFASHSQQRLAWRDAEEARAARLRAEYLAQERMEAMLDANPSGQLGNAKLDDPDALLDSGLL